MGIQKNVLGDKRSEEGGMVTLGDDQEEGDRFSRHPNVDVMCQISVLSL
jgi:hypothetical protein